jgi:hypothetical protein
VKGWGRTVVQYVLGWLTGVLAHSNAPAAAMA